jgi:hypothetical protein
MAVNPNAFGAHAILTSLASRSYRVSARAVACGYTTGQLDLGMVRVVEDRGHILGRGSGDLTLFTAAYALASSAPTLGASDR